MDGLTKGLIFLAGVAIGTIIYRLYKKWRYLKAEMRWRIYPAKDQYLDRIGEQWGVKRRQGECDGDYRKRLIAAYEDVKRYWEGKSNGL